jgi:hypothetical protein
MKSKDDSQFLTPILFIIFNNPEVSKKTFEKIKQIKPAFLYIAADGPRDGVIGEQQRCLNARKVIDEVNWDCDLRTFFRPDNSGSAALGVWSAIKWFFDNVEEGIVLEYDTVPHIDFFYFCQDLLERYRNTKKVMFISGNNFQDLEGDYSYYFSYLPTLWGFATWRNAISLVESDVKKIDWNSLSLLLPYRTLKNFSRYWWWKNQFMRRGKIDTWDYQILFSIWENKGVAIIPRSNLVTHYVDGVSLAENFNQHIPGITNVPTTSILPLEHPKKIMVNHGADIFFIEKFKLTLSLYRFLYEYLAMFILPAKMMSAFRLLKNFSNKDG